MSNLKELFEPICQDVEKELKKVLKGLLTGPIVKGYLPQGWIFITELETFTFSVDKKGNAIATEGAGEAPDVTISIDHEYLAAALKERKKPDFEYKNFDVKFHTGKGETAFNYLRKRLGL
jgi:hypothetical protein